MMAFSIIALLLTVTYVLIFIGYLFGWFATAEYEHNGNSGQTRVSIVVAARNEELNIGNLLQHLALQVYPARLTEIIVVDDFSTDNTAGVVKGFTQCAIRYISLQSVLKAERQQGGFKKKALEAGIATATGELIVTTDADCHMQQEWLSTLVGFYERQKCDMVVAPVVFDKGHSWFEKMQALDFAGMMAIAAATLHFNIPALCNGANLAFRKASFAAVNGYSGIDNVASGDDVLLMQKMAQRGKGSVRFLKSRQALVHTYAQKNLAQFAQQRIRWTSKSSVYIDKRVTLNLVLVYLFNSSILCATVLSFFNSYYAWLLLFQLAMKMIVEFGLLASATSFLRQRRLLLLFFPAQILHIFYIVIIGTVGNFLKPTWKDRKL